jgi:hypothetical protein
VQWTAGGGHAITISGASGGKYKGHDPEGYTIDVNYGGLTTYEPPYAAGRYTGKWTQSVSTSSGEARKLRNPPMTRCKQECSGWEWASSAVMAASMFGGPQGTIRCFAAEEDVVRHELGLPYCDSLCTRTGCDSPGTSANIADGIQFLSGHSYSTGGVLSETDLISKLKNGPVVLVLSYVSKMRNGSISIALDKFDRGFTGYDPNGSSLSIRSHAQLTTYKPRYGGTGTWVETVYTDSGADLVV